MTTGIERRLQKLEGELMQSANMHEWLFVAEQIHSFISELKQREAEREGKEYMPKQLTEERRLAIAQDLINSYGDRINKPTWSSVYHEIIVDIHKPESNTKINEAMK